MENISNLYFSKRPNNLGQMGRCLTKNLFTKKDLIIPSIVAEQQDVKLDQDRITSYRNIFQFEKTDNQVPAIYPHILAFPLHLELMLHPRFPRTPIGMVHLHNTIEQYRQITSSETLTIRVQLGQQITTHRGVEFDIDTKIYGYGDLIWKSTSTNLIRSRSSENNKPKQKSSYLSLNENTSSNNITTEMIDMPINWGIQYGLISGDLNPIHLYPWSAKIFGFQKNIAHGMASAAAIFSILNKKMQLEKFKFKTSFKRPIFLPNKAELCFTENTDSKETLFEITSIGNIRKNIEKEINIIGSLSSI